MEVDSSSGDEYDNEPSSGPPKIAAPIAVRPTPSAPSLNTSLAIISYFVRLILNKWSGYQIAVYNQSGGSDTREKDDWLLEELTKFLVNTKDLSLYELCDWLDDVLDSEFNLHLEDDSTEVAARALLDVTNQIYERLVKKANELAPPPLEGRKTEREKVIEDLNNMVASINF